MGIGDRIRERRIRLGMSQEELAKKLGYNSRSTINKIELGIHDVNQSKVKAFANALDTTITYLMNWEDENYYEVPILGTVPCGEPIEAIEDIIGYIDVPNPKMKKDHFGLIARGDSMYPEIKDGDILLVKQTYDVPSGSIAIVKIDNDEATCKKVMINPQGITLFPLNPSYEPKFYSAEQCEFLPVVIIGKVVEIRRKF